MLDISICIKDQGIIVLDKNGITESTDVKDTNINIDSKNFKQLLTGEITIVELIADKDVTYTGDVLEVIKLSQQFHYREKHQLV